MPSIPSWAIAAGLLIVHGGAWHSTDLTDEVLKTRLSNLGCRGGRTPWKTLRSDIIENHGDIFDYSWSGGYYEICDESRALSKEPVRRAITVLIKPKLEEYAFLVSSLVEGRRYLSREKLEESEYRMKELELLFQRVALGKPKYAQDSQVSSEAGERVHGAT